MNISSLLSPDESQTTSTTPPTPTEASSSPARPPKKNVRPSSSGKRAASGLSQEILLEPEEGTANTESASASASSTSHPQTPNTENLTFSLTSNNHTPTSHPIVARPPSSYGATSSANIPSHHAFPLQSSTTTAASAAAPNFRQYHNFTSHPAASVPDNHAHSHYYQHPASPHPHSQQHHSSPLPAPQYVSAHAHPPHHHHERPVIQHRHSSTTSMETLAGKYHSNGFSHAHFTTHPQADLFILLFRPCFYATAPSDRDEPEYPCHHY
ncbi:hypothetical protein MBLNU230_g3958t1 [Neophaeotheca triangularis]